MRRKWIASTLAAVACVAITSAATRATFIMVNGSRASGELVYHGGQANNMIDNQLNLGDNGKEQSYPMDQVAVIDIAGGTPSQDELSKALVNDQSMVLRNGFVQGGRFVNIQGGTTLVWRNDSRQEQRYGLGDVARIYLNTRSARSLFNFTAPAAPPPPPRASQPATPAPKAQRRGSAIIVPANQPWVDTGILVRAGDSVTFRVTGQVVTAQGFAPVGPEGKTGETADKYPMPTMQVGALIGRAGNAALFTIGSQQTPISMPAGGTLYLGINDDFFGDNTGAFSVNVQVNGRPR